MVLLSLEALERMQVRSLEKSKVVTRTLRSLALAVFLSFKSKTSLQKIHGAYKMITTADFRRRSEALECRPEVQETKIFFIDEDSDQVLTRLKIERNFRLKKDKRS